MYSILNENKKVRLFGIWERIPENFKYTEMNIIQCLALQREMKRLREEFLKVREYPLKYGFEICIYNKNINRRMKREI